MAKQQSTNSCPKQQPTDSSRQTVHQTTVSSNNGPQTTVHKQRSIKQHRQRMRNSSPSNSSARRFMISFSHSPTDFRSGLTPALQRLGFKASDARALPSP